MPIFNDEKIEINGFIMHKIYNGLNLTSFLVISALKTNHFLIRRAYGCLLD